jgi:enamine deaminase RidA (YjgF/YER057c/UK114 family)
MSTSKPQNFNPSGHATASPAYSHISRLPLSPTTTLITLAGQVGVRTDLPTPGTNATTTPPTLGEQCAIAFANVDKCLAAAGASKSDIVHVRHYVVDLLRDGQGQDPARQERYLEWMGELRPPSTLLGVQALAAPGLLYEIDVVCVVRQEVQHQA